MRLILCVVLVVQVWAQVDYTGYSVFRIKPTNEAIIDALWELKAKYDTKLDFWREPSTPNVPVDLMVPPQLLVPLKRTLLQYGAEVMINNVQELIARERTPGKQFFESYNRYDEIVSYLQSTCTSSNNCNLVNIGQSYEGRDMYVAQIGGDTNKPILFLECGIHAREWVSPAVCLNIIDRLIVQGGSEADGMLDDYNFHIITNSNPDGYEFTFTSNRMWRKTRSVNAGSSCFGCDPNRNFDYEFGGAGTSANPCSDIFRGSSAFSEAETANIRDYVRPREGGIRAYYSVHSYGQWFLIPWSYARNTYPEDFDDMLRVAREGTEAIRAQSGFIYDPGQSADMLGATAGCSDDWAKGTCGIKFAYTIELRDTGRYGFLLPEDQIQPNFEEIWASFVAMCDFMSLEYPGP